ncbi:MAG: MFS transporter [Gordonia sp. (in: high G+C Gram-positive bacteria)]
MDEHGDDAARGAGTITAARRWAILFCSLAAALATTCVVSGTAYLIPELHADAGLTLTQAATLSTIPTIGLMVSILGWGILLDRHGERRILLISMSIAVVGAAGAALAAAADASYLTIAALLLIGGIGSGAANGASGRLVVAWFPPDRRGTAMGIRQTAQPLGVGVCALTMPVLAAQVGVATALGVPAVMTAVGLLAVLCGVREPARAPTLPDPGARPVSSPPNPYRANMFLVRVHAVSMLLVIPQSMLWTFVPTWLITQHHWNPATAGGLITLTQIAGAAGRVAAGRWSDRWGSRMRPISAIASAAGLTMGALAVTDWCDSPIAVALMMVASVIAVADNGLAFTAIAEVAGPRWSGRGLAVQNTGQFLTMSATTPLFGAVIAAAGFPLAFAVAALTPLVALPLVPADAESESHPQPEPEPEPQPRR